MPENNTIDWTNLSNPAMLREIGRLLKTMRLKRNLTQEEVSEKAGLDRTTVVQLEKGRSATLLTFIQILRVLERLDALDGLQEAVETSPLQAAKLLAKTRMRASTRVDPTASARTGNPAKSTASAASKSRVDPTVKTKPVRPKKSTW